MLPIIFLSFTNLVRTLFKLATHTKLVAPEEIQI